MSGLGGPPGPTPKRSIAGSSFCKVQWTTDSVSARDNLTKVLLKAISPVQGGGRPTEITELDDGACWPVKKKSYTRSISYVGRRLLCHHVQLCMSMTPRQVGLDCRCEQCRRLLNSSRYREPNI